MIKYKENSYKIVSIGLVFMLNVFFSTHLMAGELTLVPSIDLQFTTWSGKDETVNDSYETGSTMRTLSLMMQKDRWYSGILFKSGTFEFNDIVPKQDNGVIVNPLKVRRSDFDVVAGYYYWDRISFFVDLKSTSMAWVDSDYIVGSGGIGFGVSGYYPIKYGVLYSSFAIVNLTASVEKLEVGKGNGSSFEFGWVNKVSATMSLKIGIKSQSQIIDYVDIGEQVNNVGGLVVGISKAFTL